jgi:Asp-tRNA(Asn)/Glu-tRNA(Gln) amidotransferase A subunit family amidase
MARTVDGCVRMMEVLVPGFEPREHPTPRVGVAWLDHCEPLVAARVREVAQELGARPVDLPLDPGTYPLFMREVADVHRDLFADHADEYGDNVRIKIERCLTVADAEVEKARQAREVYREAAEAALEGIDVLLTPTLALGPPPADVPELEVRETLIRFTYPFNLLGWPALALPAGTTEDALPASVQLVARPGEESLLLSIGASLERGTA